ncbi:MAG: LysM peptidoglycan-binding domain-containing protein [Lentisphaeria bacterium]|nr:LysM peptidoglycan-binding domain-containing protein [Lentisphaeria bacterium]
MRFSVISLFAAAALAAPFVSAQTVQPAGGATPQPVSASSGAANAAAARTASTGTRRDIVSYVEELAGNTAAQLRAVQDENAELETRVIALERRIAELQETNQKLLNEIAVVKRQSAADADAREAQMKAILSKIDKLAATPVPVATVPAPVSTADDYDIYEVQKGATLSVIAKAYSEAYGKTVTVQEIKKANNLKSDLLQVGQKLKIPRK